MTVLNYEIIYTLYMGDFPCYDETDFLLLLTHTHKVTDKTNSSCPLQVQRNLWAAEPLF